MHLTELLSLQRSQVLANLYDVVTCPLINVGIVFSEIVKDVLGKRAIPRPNFVDDEVLVREVLQEVLGDQALSNGPAVPRLPT